MSLGLKWLFPKESNFHLTPSEGAGLPLSQGTINRLVVQLGFEPSLRVSKTPVRPIHHWTFVKGFQSDHIGFQSCIHGLATSDILFPYSLHFLGFLSEPVNQVYFPCGCSTFVKHSAQHVDIGLKRGSVCRASVSPVATSCISTARTSIASLSWLDARNLRVNLRTSHSMNTQPKTCRICLWMRL